MDEKTENTCYPSIGQAVWLILAVFFLQIAFAAPLSMGMDVQEHPLVLAFASLFSFGVVLFWGIRRNHRPIAEILPLPPVRISLVFPVVLTIFGLVILLSEVDNAVRSVLPPPKFVQELFQSLTESATLPWESFIAVVMVAPLTEEFFFRGLILRSFLSRYSVGTSVLVSALLFGLLHANPWQFFSATVLGIVFAWWALRTQSLLPCLVGHSCNNALVLFHSLLPFRVRGFNQVESFSSAQFQPLWFDLTGMLLLGLGLWVFWRLTPKTTTESVVSG